jgi:hypothetical protein
VVAGVVVVVVVDSKARGPGSGNLFPELPYQGTTSILPYNVRDGLETFHKSFHCGWKLLGARVGRSRQIN